MKESTIQELSTIITKIQKGDFSATDVKVLLFDLRHGNGEVLKEMGDFMAHEGERNRGISYEDVRELIDRFDTFVKSGGEMSFGGPVFDQKEIIDSLAAAIKKHRIPKFDETSFSAQAFPLMTKILELVAGTRIIKLESEAKNVHLSKVEKIENGNQVVYFSFDPPKVAGGLLNAKTVRTTAFLASKL